MIADACLKLDKKIQGVIRFVENQIQSQNADDPFASTLKVKMNHAMSGVTPHVMGFVAEHFKEKQASGEYTFQMEAVGERTTFSFTFAKSASQRMADNIKESRSKFVPEIYRIGVVIIAIIVAWIIMWNWLPPGVESVLGIALLGILTMIAIMKCSSSLAFLGDHLELEDVHRRWKGTLKTLAKLPPVHNRA